MKKEVFTFVRRMFISAAIFFAVALPFKYLFSLVPGVTEIRPANVVPPVLGVLFGLPAAVGISVGNLISDILSGSNAFICITGFIANFLYSYLPYRMWYTEFASKGKVTPPNLSSMKDVLKFIFVIFINSLLVTILLMLIFETAGFGTSGDNAPLLFFNNFDFAVILGVPLLSILANSRIVPHTPKRKEKTGKRRLFLNVTSVLPYVISAVGIGYFCFSKFGNIGMNPKITLPLMIVFMLLLIIYILRPFTAEIDTAVKKKARFSIKAKVTVGFLITAVVFIAFVFRSTYDSVTMNGEIERLVLVNHIYLVVGIAINIIFGVTILALWYVETKITTPIEMISRLVDEFAGQDHLGENDNKKLKEMCVSIQENTKDEIGELAHDFNRMMSDIENYVMNIRTVTAEKERIGAELSIATQIQANMLPCIFPAFPERNEFDIYATMNPAKEVGGDFYDFFMVDDRHLAIVMADVSGKGVPAALFMVIGKTLIKDHTTPGKDLGEVFTEVNELLCESNSEGLFITAFEGVIDLSSGAFRYVNAGHEIPYICKKDGKFEPYKIRAGFVLAGMEGMKYKCGELELEPGDKIFQYTDGVTEATNANNELYGMDRLTEILGENSALAPTELLPVIKNDIDRFVGEAPQFDDITMLCLEYKERMEDQNERA